MRVNGTRQRPNTQDIRAYGPRGKSISGDERRASRCTPPALAGLSRPRSIPRKLLFGSQERRNYTLQPVPGWRSLGKFVNSFELYVWHALCNGPEYDSQTGVTRPQLSAGGPLVSVQMHGISSGAYSEHLIVLHVSP